MVGKAEVPIIWDDEHIIVIDKPPGLLSIPDGYDLAAPHVKSILSKNYGPLWIVHRLDRNTSGVMVLARNAPAHRQLNLQFQERRVNKVYIALIVGDPDWDRKVIDQPLKENVGHQHRTVIDLQNGKPSVTLLKVLDRFDTYCLVEASPQTGRRHQIRAHLLAEGFPIACDSLYGTGSAVYLNDIDNNIPNTLQSEEPLIDRPSLHARSIEFDHPITHKRSIFEAPYPKDFKLTLDILRNQTRRNLP
jgi:RluA family pseudouridine synthase